MLNSFKARFVAAGVFAVLVAQQTLGSTFTVSTTSDLINAINLANGAAGSHTINLAAGTYILNGELPIITTNRNITFQGASADPAATVLHQSAAHARFLETLLPTNNANNVILTFINLTFEKGRGGDCGGGALLVGGIGSSTTIRNCIFFDNNTQTGAGVLAGGAIENSPNGDLTITGCRFQNNSSSYYGGAVDFLNQTGGSGNLVISNSVFIGNWAASDGGAIKASAGTGSIQIQGCSFECNSTTSGRGGVIAHGDGPITLAYNRFFSNTAATHANGDTIFQPGGEPAIDARLNWWGQNSGPCGTDIYAVGSATITTWLQMRFSAGATTLGTGCSTVLTADLFGLNAGGPLSGASLLCLPACPSSLAPVFHDPVSCSISGASDQFVQGIAVATLTAGPSDGLASVTASLDNQTLSMVLSLIVSPNQPPIAPSQTFVRSQGMTLKIAIADVLAACADPDGGTLALDSIGTSALGASLSKTASHILYQISSGNNNSDSFPYTISDGQGGTTSGAISVIVVKPGGLAQSVSVSGGSVTIEFAGIPGYTYDIERASAPDGPWTLVETDTAPAHGLFSFTDTTAPMPMAYYRLEQH